MQKSFVFDPQIEARKLRNRNLLILSASLFSGSNFAYAFHQLLIILRKPNLDFCRPCHCFGRFFIFVAFNVRKRFSLHFGPKMRSKTEQNRTTSHKKPYWKYNPVWPSPFHRFWCSFWWFWIPFGIPKIIKKRQKIDFMSTYVKLCYLTLNLANFGSIF